MKVIGSMLFVFVIGIYITLGALRYDLIVIQQPFWLLLLGAFSVLGGVAIVACGIPAGGIVITAGVISFALAGYKAVWPHTAAATSHAQEVADKEGALSINNAVAPKLIPCHRDMQPRMKFFDPVTGEPIVWVAADRDTGRFECYDRPGYHSITRKKLVPVDEVLALAILKQDPPSTPTPIATPTTLLLPSASPLPSGDDGPIDHSGISPQPLRELGTAFITDEDRNNPGTIIPVPMYSPTPTPTPR